MRRTVIALTLVFTAALLTGLARPSSAQVITYAPLRFPSGTKSAPGISFLATTNAGMFVRSNTPIIAESGSERMGFNSAAASVLSNMSIAWTNSTSDSVDTKDLYLSRSAANVLIVTSDGSTDNTASIGTSTVRVKAINSAAYNSGANNGVTGTATVCSAGACTSTCTMIFTGGVRTGGTC